MISVENALKIILSEISAQKAEKIMISEASGRVICEDIKSGVDVPSSNNSAMDGYALRHTDTDAASGRKPVSLRIIGEARAGAPFAGILSKNTAVRIMTGAVMPSGADSVARLEDADEHDGFVRLKKPVAISSHVRYSGEDIKRGETLFKKGAVLKPADTGILASIRKRSVGVYKKPSVAIVCTGDELISVDDDFTKGSVISSNLYSLCAQAEEAGAIPVSLGIVRDDKKAMLKMFKKGFEHDFLVTSGGISAGEYDLVKSVLERLGAENRIYKTAMKPGMPFSFFTCGKAAVFALPGNPVSCMVSFEILVRPALLKALGHTAIFRRRIDALLEENINKKKGYKFFSRGIIRKGKNGYSVKSTGPQGSGILRSMSLANGLIIGAAGRETLKKGDLVKVIVIDEGFERGVSF